MSERTGGHSLDTGEGPVPLDHPLGRGAESPVATAWRAYVQHMHGDCDDCNPHTRTCPVANELWAAYTGTRHTA